MKRWINKINKSLEQNIRDNEEEERKQGVVEMVDDESEGEEEKDPEQKARKFLAFYNWTCPNCNFAYAERNLPRYKCFCGKFEEPEYNPLILPHSCGEYCEKKKHKDCTHDTCEINCHPGACPPCNISVSVKCYCEKEAKYVPCMIAGRSQFSCQDECGRLLNCGIHRCEKMCHAGPCEPC